MMIERVARAIAVADAREHEDAPNSEPERFYLSQDNDSHWYVVPVAREEDWDAWLGLGEDEQAAWDVPDFAQPVGGSPSLVTFTDARIT